MSCPWPTWRCLAHPHIPAGHGGVWVLGAHVMFGAVLTVLVIMIICHEAAHAIAAWACGGCVEAVVMKSIWAIGLRIRIDSLSPRQVAITLMAAPFAELLVISAAWVIRPEAWKIWLALLGVQWALNMIPWPGLSTDGRKLWVLQHHGVKALGESRSGQPPLI